MSLIIILLSQYQGRIMYIVNVMYIYHEKQCSKIVIIECACFLQLSRQSSLINLTKWWLNRSLTILAAFKKLNFYLSYNYCIAISIQHAKTLLLERLIDYWEYFLIKEAKKLSILFLELVICDCFILQDTGGWVSSNNMENAESF